MVVAVSLMAIRSLVPLNVAGVDVCFVHSTLSASDQKACMLTDDLFKRHSGMVWDPGRFEGSLRRIETYHERGQGRYSLETRALLIFLMPRLLGLFQVRRPVQAVLVPPRLFRCLWPTEPT